MPGSGQPRLPSGQVTSSELTTVTAAASTPSRLLRSAVAWSTTLPGLAGWEPLPDGVPGWELLLDGVIDGCPPVADSLPHATRSTAAAATIITLCISITSHSRRRTGAV